MKFSTYIEFNLLLILTVFFTQFSAKSFSKLSKIIKQDLKDEKHGIKMGKVFFGCDDAKNNLEIDWDGSPINYTCYTPHNPLAVRRDVESIEECQPIPHKYFPQHHCMSDTIDYNTTLPTFGDHRPLWPMFGEYLFVPPQRWLHNVEHGSIIMLYHPCANKVMVSRLRAIVTNCLRKHIITAYNLMDERRPLALIAWGCRLSMNWVDTFKVISFIKKNSMKGPEGDYPKEGQYRHSLIRLAEIPVGSDRNDSKICPFV